MQRDGKCDDGSRGEEDQVFCDLGTDCSDCGNWTAQLPPSQIDQTLPLKLLHDRHVSAHSIFYVEASMRIWQAC